MRRYVFLLGTVVALLVVPGAYARGGRRVLSPTQAAQAVGQRATVCGVVASVHFAARSRDRPTFIDLGQPYPDQVFTIVIWGDDRSRFNPVPETWQGKKVCVTGFIKLYRGTPEVVAYGPDQIRVLSR